MKLLELYRTYINENNDADVISDIKTRINQKQFKRYMDDENWKAGDEDDALEYFLSSEYSLSVDSDGIIEFYTLDKDTTKLIGDNFVKLYHFAPAKFKDGIQSSGLVPGVTKTNPYKNSYSGIYLTTETSGAAVDGYIYHIQQKHGDAIQVTVKMKLSEIKPDPDDAGLASGNTQFITSRVGADRIIEIEERY